jgi:hypothetical protein
MENNIKETYKAQYFRKIMSRDGPESILQDVAARIF